MGTGGLARGGGLAVEPSTDSTLTVPRAAAWLRLTDARREFAIAACAYLVYEIARILAVGELGSAVANGRAILAIEAVVGLDVEAALNDGIRDLPPLALASCYFYATAHYVVSLSVLVWLFRRHRRVYGPARTALLLTMGISFVGHWLLPTAPPRMLPGFEDTMISWASWGWWVGSGGVPAAMKDLSNPVAAMPSLHVAFAAWCGWLVFRLARRAVVRVLAAGYPLVTSLVVVVTANHYVLDVVAGVAIVAVGGLASHLLGVVRARRAETRQPAEGRPAVAVPVPREPEAGERVQ